MKTVRQFSRLGAPVPKNDGYPSAPELTPSSQGTAVPTQASGNAAFDRYLPTCLSRAACRLRQAILNSPQPIPPRDFQWRRGDCIGMECLVRFDAATLSVCLSHSQLREP